MQSSESEMNINELAITYDADEDFEEGRQMLAAMLDCNLRFDKALDETSYANILQTDEQKLAAFWFAYFTARLKIEQSYDFLLANQVFNWGCFQLDAMVDASLKPEACTLLQMKVAVRLVELDRGMHNNHFVTAEQACHELLSLIGSEQACTTSLEMERSYVEAILTLTQLLVRRDKGGLIGADEWQSCETVLRSAYEFLKPKKIYASIIKSYLCSLDYLKAVVEPKLVVTDGRLISTFYATVNSIEAESLVAVMEDESKRKTLMDLLQVDQFYEPEPPDILSDLSEDRQFHIWQFDLPAVSLPSFRGVSLDYALSLRFNNLGLLQLNFECPLDGLDVNAIRHLSNMALENALDESIDWPVQANLFYLRDVASFVLETIDSWFGGGDNLIYSVGEHVNTTVLIETIEQDGVAGRFLNFQELMQHPEWIGLTIPPREVRSAYENWRVQKPHNGVQNIATDLYHADNWVQADGSYALIVQLDQPSWVTDQALENVLVSTGSRYFMQQLGKMLFSNVRRIQLEYHDDEDIETKSRLELKQQEQLYRRRVKQLHLLNLEVRDLLHLMDTGGLMRFPDHGRFVKRLFSAVGVDSQRVALQETMQESQEATRFLRVQITTALEKERERSSQRFDAVIGFMGILLSVTAMSDMFDLIEDTGVAIPDVLEVEIVFGLMALIVLYFSVEAIIRKFK